MTGLACIAASVPVVACDGTDALGSSSLDVDAGFTVKRDASVEDASAVDASATCGTEPECAANRLCCGDTCVDARTDVGNCGACGTTCALANGTNACVDGKCVVTACNAGFEDCDGDPTNGCEVDTRNDPAHCGGCGMACSTAHIAAACSAGECTGVCADSFADCNGNKRADGCELDTTATIVETFEYTGAVQTVTVPACVTRATIDAFGAQGGSAVIGGAGGLGGRAQGELAVTAGDTLAVRVGGQNGYNGGGTGGRDGNPTGNGPGGMLAPSGGGASDVRVGGAELANRVVVAAGGGGAGNNGTWIGCQVAGPAGAGGAGGALEGATGTNGTGTPCNCGGGGGAGGTGGTQTTGGTHGSYAGSASCLRASWVAGSDGVLGQGGAGATAYHNGTGGGGGGGGGYYGGGAGGSGSDTTPGGGGGGGSSWLGALTNASSTAGVREGNGRVTITYSY